MDRSFLILTVLLAAMFAGSWLLITAGYAYVLVGMVIGSSVTGWVLSAAASQDRPTPPTSIYESRNMP